MRAVADVMEGARPEPGELKGRGKLRRVAEPELEYQRLSPAQQAAKLKALEQQMHQHARDLEFEDAARVRDQLALLREQAFGAPGHDLNVVPLVTAPGSAKGAR